MTVVIYILALAAYIWLSCLWIVGGWFTLSGDESLFFNWDENILAKILISFYLLSIPTLAVLGFLGTMAYF